MKPLSTLALWLALFLAAPASAGLYQWTDGRGTLHFTDHSANIPAEYRGKVETAAAGSHRLQLYESKRAKRVIAAVSHSLTEEAVSHSLTEEEILVPFERDGNLMKVNVSLNDNVVAPFYLDTGASHVSIPARVADQLGLDHGSTAATVAAETANGVVHMPTVNLESVQLGAAEVTNLRGTVNSSLEVGLLGGSFLNNFLYSIDSARGVIVLKPHLR